MSPISFHPSPKGERAWHFPPNLSTTSPPTISESGNELSLQTVGKTDWWRTSYEWRSSGASYMFVLEEDEKAVMEKESKKELSVAVKLDGKWEVQFDQAALFLLFSNSLWVKTGIEYTEGKAWVSVVVTNRWSDWSLRPIPVDAATPLHFEIKLKGHHLRVFLNGEMMREVNGFAFDVSAEERKEARVGVMGCSPIGEGTKVTFNDFQLDVVEGIEGH